MLTSKITTLTLEQEQQIPIYREKWRTIALLTKPINREEATIAVENIYRALKLSQYKILIVDSPLAASEIAENCKEENIYHRLHSFFANKLWRKLGKCLDRNIIDLIEKDLEMTLALQLFSQFAIHIYNQINVSGNPHVQSEMCACYGCNFDFCIEVLQCECNLKIWNLLKSLITTCGHVYLFEKMAIICDRPRFLSFDENKLLHAEGTPAIQYADGFSIYAYHGVRLPEKYGKLNPAQWRSQWLLEEENTELRRVLIQGIGYGRICQELNAIELDSWQEYNLLVIDNEVDVEPVFLLKMTCPSTGFIHALRVPPNMKTAREAISWANWGIDPEEFGVST